MTEKKNALHHDGQSGFRHIQMHLVVHNQYWVRLLPLGLMICARSFRSLSVLTFEDNSFSVQDWSGQCLVTPNGIACVSKLLPEYPLGLQVRDGAQTPHIHRMRDFRLTKRG